MKGGKYIHFIKQISNNLWKGEDFKFKLHPSFYLTPETPIRSLEEIDYPNKRAADCNYYSTYIYMHEKLVNYYETLCNYFQTNMLNSNCSNIKLENKSESAYNYMEVYVYTAI